MAEAGRVIAGRARGIRLLAPGPGTRPLSDRVKETLFAILEPELRDARVLDLFAGSGAAGIEALSRGAAAAVFIERDPAAVAIIGENLRRTGLAGSAALVVRSDALAYLAGLPQSAPLFDVAIVDPPYADVDQLARALSALGDPARPLVASGGRVVAKHFWRDRPPGRVGLLASIRERRFGETSLTFYALGDEGPAAGDGPAGDGTGGASEPTEAG
jgi:16S rRNA (guanine966-N2)-methyltransferase